MLTLILALALIATAFEAGRRYGRADAELDAALSAVPFLAEVWDDCAREHDVNGHGMPGLPNPYRRREGSSR